MTTPRSRTLTRQIVVRVPPWLYEALQADAAAHGRTLAQSARFILARAVRPDDDEIGRNR